MPRVSPILAAAVAVLCLAAAPAARAGYAEGVAAYGAGRHDVAAREFLAAAQAGDAESAYMLGRLYAMGSGVAQDWVQAWMWHDRAARQGHELAAASRESLEAIMTPDQLARLRAAPSPTAVTQRPPSVEAYDTGAYNPVTPGPAVPQVPVGGERQAVFVPREGVVASVPAPTAPPAMLSANGATFEGMLSATGGLPEQTRLVQRRLNREGYWAGPVDGRVGALTRQAIRQYQRDQGLAVTGRISPDLVARLGAEPPPVVVRVDPPTQAADAR
ncbi:MAG: peptidoglycan-binding protein [Pseudomonadota bacterium]